LRPAGTLPASRARVPHRFHSLSNDLAETHHEAYLSLALLPLAFIAACSDSNRPAGAGVLQSVVFETRTEVPVGAGGAVEAVLADLDGDRDLDLAVACHSGTVQILLGANNGTFQARSRCRSATGRSGSAARTWTPMATRISPCCAWMPTRHRPAQ